MTQSNSGNYMDYMDGVPVKVSDKYKPPPEITLPYGVVESSARASELIQNTHYDFGLETNVLKKLIEWQNARDTMKNARNHRLQLLEEARQRELDLKAATETEEKLKQLSISEVSYPSTEEISEISPDDNEESKPLSESVVSVSRPSEVCVETIPENNLYTTINMAKSDVVCDILQPVPVSTSSLPWSLPTNLLDDPHPFSLPLPHHLHSQHTLQYLRNNCMKNSLDHLTYSDFENDTSSPFDNMELKTINDKELLAQVLNINQTSNIVPNYEGNVQMVQGVDVPQHYNGYVSNQPYSKSHSTNSIDSNVPKPLYISSVQGDVTTESNTLQPYPYIAGGVLHNNGYYHEPTRNVNSSGKTIHYLNTNIQPPPGNYYAPEYNYSTANSTYQAPPNVNDKPFVYNNQLGEQSYNVGTTQYQRNNITSVNQSFVNPYPYYNTNNYSYYTTANTNTNMNDNTTYLPLNKDATQIAEETAFKTESKTLFGSRSRSVPDIVKELDEEVAKARMRAKERSHNCSPSIRPSSESVSTVVNKVEQLDNPYNELSPELQGTCKRISAMGFPLDRVARACEEIGAEDKKIIEYLLVMGQLLDLGFSESSVSEALLKHSCNRDKALDDLIS